MENVYDNTPKHGTVVGTATEEELKKHREIVWRGAAIDRLSMILVRTDNPAALLELLQSHERERGELWYPIYKRLNIPWVCELKMDNAHGYIYIHNSHEDY